MTFYDLSGGEGLTALWSTAVSGGEEVTNVVSCGEQLTAMAV